MTYPSVSAIEALGKYSIKLAHADRKIGLWCLNQQVIMIRHQTIRMTDPAVARDDVSEGLKKQLAVAVAQKDLLARITPTSQMINCACKFQPKRPCHGELVSGYLFDCKT